jgi:hypothetical protein
LNDSANASALKLYEYLFRKHWTGVALIGPDPGLMINLRFFRFVKSYISSLRQTENVFFLQAQGYWIKSCWELFARTNEPNYKAVALSCSNYVLQKQRADGSWQYPLKEWQSYVSTVEGTWAALGLLESYQYTNDPIFLIGALKWYNFLVKEIGFQPFEDAFVINYFAFSQRGVKVPNNTTLALWFMARLFDITGDDEYLKYTNKMIRFLELTQQPNGELVYELNIKHYLCYHYNAFEFIDLFYFYKITQSLKAKSILKKLANYLVTGVTEIGSVKYNCNQTYPEMPMFASVTGAALKCASSMELGNYELPIKRIYNYIVANQKSDGSFTYSNHDFIYLKSPIQYGFLRDENRYPGPLSFMLDQLLIGSN